MKNEDLIKINSPNISDQNGECFAREINPLNLTTRPGSPEPLENLEMDPFLTTGKLSALSSSSEKSHNDTRRKYMEYSSSSSSSSFSSSSNHVRRKRDEDAVKAEAYTDRKHVINLVSDLRFL